MTPSSAFLNVEHSFTGRRWVARHYDERMTLALAQRFELPDFMARCLSARGHDLETTLAFLDPKLRDLLPDPSRFKDMDRAAARFVGALANGERIAVFGDYDVDGGTSAALLARFGRAVGVDLRLYIPDRLREGYGPNAAAMRSLAAETIKVVICVDCGITAHEALGVAQDAGLDVIVLDHHAAEPSLPPAYAVVNPNRLDEPMGATYGALAAVGVTYLFIIAVNRVLRAAGFYTPERPEPDLRQWLDLVALGTVCDVVKLTGLNRAFVTQGLKIMAQTQNEGLKALADVAGVKGPRDTFAAGFMLGPRVNAGGRVGEAGLGAQLLACDDPVLARHWAEKLHQLNAERRAIEAQVLAEAEALPFDETAPLVFAARDNWHPGVIGIVASRLKDKYHRPSLVIALEGDVGKGSGRSLGAVDLGAAVIAARQAGLLVNGGGHKMAAGLTVARDKIDELKAFLYARLATSMEAEPLRPTLTLDGLMMASALQVPVIEKLASLAPFGAGNAEPRFAFPSCRIVRAQVVGENHVSLILMHGGTRLRAIAFRAMQSNLGTALLSQGSRPCHVAGHVRCEEWQGKKGVQLTVDDAAAG